MSMVEMSRSGGRMVILFTWVLAQANALSTRLRLASWPQ